MTNEEIKHETLTTGSPESVIPPVIYHYCSLETFKAIIENKTLRLSDITRSNDSEEIRYIVNIINTIFHGVYDNDNNKAFKRYISWDYFQEKLGYRLMSTFDKDYSTMSYFVMCFSKERDMLSQWRGYADDGIGVSIGFDTELILNLISAKDIDIRLESVVYDPLKQQDKIQQDIHEAYDHIKHGVLDALEWKESINPSKEEDFCKSIFSFYCDRYIDDISRLTYIAPFFKSPFFKEEKEVRLCYKFNRNKIYQKLADDDNSCLTSNVPLGSGAYLKDVNYVLNQDGMKFYRDICFKDDKFNNIIHSVILGPKCKASTDEIAVMLEKNGFSVKPDAYTSLGTVMYASDNRKIEIIPSSGTYR
jgi:hypothetical protein